MVGFSKRSPEEIVADLREKARETLDEIRSDAPEALADLGLGLALDDMLETEAADCIESLLSQIKT